LTPLRIALTALGFRLVSALLALLVNLTFPLHQREQFTVFGSTSPFWDTFARYDTGYFEGIAWSGYAPLPGGRSNIAYFPVYPMLIRAVGRLFDRHHAIFYISGVAISWVCFVLAMVALYHLARLDLPEERARRAVLLTMIFPFAFFFGVAYSESTFLLFWCWGFWTAIRFLKEGRPGWLPPMVAFGALAYLTRPEGLLLPAGRGAAGDTRRPAQL
jgi:Gpi18-like mannosyltransferase